MLIGQSPGLLEAGRVQASAAAEESENLPSFGLYGKMTAKAQVFAE
jgi:hypothetical protein